MGAFLLPDNSPRRIQVKVPIILPKFMEGREMAPADFFRIWQEQPFMLSEATTTANISRSFGTSPLVFMARCAQFGRAMKMHVGFDSNPDNMVLVGRVNGGDASVEGALCLARLEIGSGSYVGKVRVSVRSENRV